MRAFWQQTASTAFEMWPSLVEAELFGRPDRVVVQRCARSWLRHQPGWPQPQFPRCHASPFPPPKFMRNELDEPPCKAAPRRFRSPRASPGARSAARRRPRLPPAAHPRSAAARRDHRGAREGRSDPFPAWSCARPRRSRWCRRDAEVGRPVAGFLRRWRGSGRVRSAQSADGAGVAVLDGREGSDHWHLQISVRELMAMAARDRASAPGPCAR